MAGGIARFANRVALVTGASAGIGAAVCEALVKHGLTVVGCARRKDLIDEHSKKLKAAGLSGKLHSYQCDVAKEDEVDKMFQWLNKALGGADICINNAAIAAWETLLNSDAKSLRKMFDLNVIGLIMCTKYAIQSMRERGVVDGHIIQMNAVLGHEIRGFLNAYSASKYAVTAVSEGFRKELRHAGLDIRVTSISPGMVKTTFIYEHTGPENSEKLYAATPHLRVEDVVDAVVYVLSQPQRVQIQELKLENVRA